MRNRVQSLINTGTIRKFTVEVAPSIRVRSLTMISVDPSVPTYIIPKKVEDLSGIESIYEVTGEYDIICVVSQRDIEGLNQTIEEIRKLDGVAKTNTVIVLRTL